MNDTLEREYLEELHRIAELPLEEMVKRENMELLTRLSKERLIEQLKRMGFLKCEP